MRKNTIYGLMTARHQREQGWSSLRNNDGGDDTGGGAGSDDSDDQDGDDGGTGDDDQDDDTESDDKKDTAKDGKSKGEKVFSEKVVRQLRSENAAQRTQFRALADAIVSVLDPDAAKKGEKADPAKLAEQLTAREATLREATAENAVLKLAAKNGGDGDALTDSREFMARVSKLDQSADNFRTKVGEAIKKFVADNPRYAATTGPRKSGPPIPNGGGQGGGKPKNLEEAFAAHYGTG